MDDDYGYEMEAIENERMEANFEDAALRAAGNRIAALKKQGICAHGAVITRMAENHKYYPEITALSIGQVLCSYCGKVFDSHDEWIKEHSDLIG